ncbi:MAG: J domain-containing protein [Pseudomonadota bacterium]
MTDLERAFEILGIAPTDDEAAIRKAWRGLVRSYHPDTARTDPEGANKRLAEINVAFDAVSACKPGDIKKLKAIIAKREQMAERMRRQTFQRQKDARAKQQAEQKAEHKKRPRQIAHPRRKSVARSPGRKRRALARLRRRKPHLRYVHQREKSGLVIGTSRCSCPVPRKGFWTR